MAKEKNENLLSQDRNQLFERAYRRDKAVQFIPITAGDDNGVFYYEQDNAIASCCEFSPLSGINQNNITALQVALNLPMPAGTIMQFIQMGSPTLDSTLNKYIIDRQQLSGSLPKDIDHTAVLSAQYAVRNRAEFLRSRTRKALNVGVDTILTQTHCYWTIKVSLKTKSPFNSGDSNFAKFEKEVAEFVKLRTQILSQLTVAGIHTKPMQHAEVLALLRKYFKMYDPWDKVYDKDELLNKQIFASGTRLSWGQKGYNSLHCSGMSDSGERQNAAMLVIDRYPGGDKYTNIGVMLNMLGDTTGNGAQFGCPYVITTTIHFPDQSKKATAFRANQGMTTKQAKPTLLKWSPRLRAKIAGFEEMDKAILDGGNIVEASTTLTLFHPSRSKLDKALDTMKAYYKRFGFVFGRERYIHAVTFFNNLPMNATPDAIKNIDRFKTMMARHATHFLPILDEWTGVDNVKDSKLVCDEMLFTTRRGRLCKYSLFSDTNKNYNWTVIAGSGSGKSFFVQRLTQDALSLGTKVWTIDTGSSYLAAARAAGAQIIDFDFESKVCLNPFTHIEDLNREIEIIAPILAKMARPNQGCNDSEINILKSAVRSVYDAMGNNADIDAIISWLNNQTGDDAAEKRKLAQDMAEFGSLGSMGKWFKGKNNFEAQADWTVIELSGLITNKHLCDVVLMIISTTISQEMFLSRGNKRKKMLIIEEGGDRVTDPSFAEFISKLYSKVRKEDGSVGVVTQTFNQMYATKFGEDIMNSATTKFYLQAETGSVDAAINKGYIQDDYAAHLMRNARTESERFSEIVITSGTNAGLCRLVETPFNRVLFSTKGDFFKELQQKVRAGEQITNLVMQEAQRRYPEEFQVT